MSKNKDAVIMREESAYTDAELDMLRPYPFVTEPEERIGLVRPAEMHPEINLFQEFYHTGLMRILEHLEAFEPVEPVDKEKISREIASRIVCKMQEEADVELMPKQRGHLHGMVTERAFTHQGGQIDIPEIERPQFLGRAS